VCSTPTALYELAALDAAGLQTDVERRTADGEIIARA
jgi:hypothetical protein